MTTGVACLPPILQFTLNNGQLAAGGSILTQVGGTNAATFQDQPLAIPLPNPIPLNSRGEISNAAGTSCQLFLTPNTVYTFTLFDGPNGTGNQIWIATYVNGVQQTAQTQASIGALLYPQTPAESAAGITPVNIFVTPGNILRYGTNTTPGTTDMTTAFNNAVAAAQSSTHGHGFVYLPAAGGPYNFASPSGGSCLTLSNVQGIQIYGDAAALTAAGTHYANNTVLIFDNGGAGNNGITVNTFIGFKMKDLVISMRRGSAGGGKALYLNSGHDFELDNIKIDLAVGVGTITGGITNTGGVILGNGTGATSTFLGSIRNVKCMTDVGAIAFASHNTNTSLNFLTCYGIGGSYNFVGNTYVSAVSCACDGASLYAYNISGNCTGMSLIACGAEIAVRGAYYINNSHQISLINPFGSGNNTSASTGIGSLVELDATGGACTNITILNPVDTNPNAATTASIVGNAGNSTTHVINANANYLFGGGVGGDPTWMQNYLTMEGDSNVEVVPFTPTLGSGWTNVGTAVVTGHYIKKGKLITFSITVTPATSIQSASLARINIPWNPTFNGSATQIDGNNQSYGVASVGAAQLFCQSTGVLTVPLAFQGSCFIA